MKHMSLDGRIPCTLRILGPQNWIRTPEPMQVQPPVHWRVPMILKGFLPQVLCRSEPLRTMGKSDTPKRPKRRVRKLRCVATRTDLKRRRQLYVLWTVSTIGRTDVSTVIWGEMLGNIGKTPLKIRPESSKKECIFQPPIFRCFIGFRKGNRMIDTCSKTKTCSKISLFLIPP